MSRIFRLSALLGASVLLLVFGMSDSAEAHVCMVYPMSRVGDGCVARSPQKMGPCGINERSANVSEFRPGETITLELNETINHPSHFRVSFNPDGGEFHDPTSIDDKAGGHPFVLLDGIEDADDAMQQLQVTFPTTPCEDCTLQLIQVMYDKQGNGFGGASGGPNDNDDIYYSCADIVLRGEPVTAEGETPDGEVARTASGGGGGFPIPIWPVLAVGVLLVLGRPGRSSKER